MRDDDNDNQGHVTQDIDGEGHQVAGRDIVNQYNDPRPKRLEECNADELRAEREWSRNIIADAKQKIKNSWPAKVAKIIIPLWFLLVYLMWPSFHWIAPSLVVMVYLPLYFYAQMNEPEYKLIRRHELIVQYVYDRLRDFGIDER